MGMKDDVCSRRSTLALGAGAGLAIIGCSDSGATGSGGSGGGGAVDISDVIYEGGATDEALLALLAKIPKSDESEGTRFIAPDEGAELSAATPPAFEWAVGMAARNAPARPTSPADPRPREGLLERALGLVLGVKEAYAHGTPISGRAYFLVIGSAGAPELVRVFTTNLSYTPSAEVWEKIVNEGGPITLSIVNAIFETNRVTQDGGPFTGTPLHVTIT